MGDRYELLAVLAAAIPLRIPLVHVSGGEITEGALDEQVRHAMTKAAHIHFVANEIFARRLARMGEEDWRIHVTGDPALDRVRRADVGSREDLETLVGLPIGRETVMVAFHPVTNSPERTWREWEVIEAALEDYGDSVVVTGSNADPQGNELCRRQKAWCAAGPDRRFIEHLGQRNFLGMLVAGGCLVGNSSAGIWEAPSVGAPAVNIGSRQKGRLRGTNVLDLLDPTAEATRAAISEALTPQFRQRLEGAPSPYGDGRAAGRIVPVLRALPEYEKLLTKRFNDEN